MYQVNASLWEKRIITDALRCNNVFIQKVPEHMQYNTYKKQVYRKRTCFDFFASINGKAIYFDAKSLGTKSFNLSGWYKSYRQQYLSLLEAHHKGNMAGLFFWFYKHKRIEFVCISTIKEHLDNGLKSVSVGNGIYSIADDERIDFNAILVALTPR